MKPLSLLPAIALYAGLFPLPAAGQDPAPADAPGASPERPVEEVIVISRGRRERVLDVPDTLTVLTAGDMEAARIRSLDSLIENVAGVHLINDQDPGTNIITVRGVSTNRLQAASIAFVVDGVQLADTELFTMRMFDTEQVEVLKGPQGALYGKNAIGGVINIRTRTPGSDAPDYLEAGAANGNTWTARGGFGGEVAENVHVRAAFDYRNSDGFIRNTFLDKKVDGQEIINGRVRLLADVTEQLSADLIFRFMDEEAGAAFISSGDVTGNFGGRLDGAALTQPFGDFEGRAKRDWQGGSLKLSYQTDAGLLSSVTGYDSYDKFFIEELDFRNDTPITLFGAPLFPDGIQPIAQPIEIDALTQEVRFTSREDRRLRWIAGAFLQATDKLRIDDFGPLLFGLEAPRVATDSLQYAVFGQASYDLTDRLEVTAALRFDRDERDERTTGVDTGTLFSDRSTSFDKVQPKVSLSWRARAGVQLYATAAQGFKTGGFNPLPGPADIHQAVFDQEETLAFEAGLKSLLLDGRLRFNAAAFYTDYEDLQTTIFLNGNSVVLGIDQVDVAGLEVEGDLDLGRGFSVATAFAYTDTEIEEFVIPDPLTGVGTLDFAGNDAPNSPRWTVNSALNYAGEAGGGLLEARLAANGVGKIFYEVDNVLFSPARWSIDSRLAWSIEGWTVAAWVRNLFDERWAISAFGQSLLPLLAGLGPGGPFDSFTINRGRQWGLTLERRF